MIDFTVDDKTKLIVDGLVDFLHKEVEPIENANAHLLENGHRLFTEDGRYVAEALDLWRQVRMKSAAAGYYTLFVPEELGGAGEGPMTFYFVSEAMFYNIGPEREIAHQAVAHWVNLPGPILANATAQVKAEVLPRLISGEHISCFGLSEPEAGSDVWRMQTKAVRDGDEWVINGAKQWISYAPYADNMLLFAVTNQELVDQHAGGISCFLVDTKTPGFQVDRVIRLFGHVGGNEGILGFQDMRVPADRLVGEVDGGMSLALRGVNTGRLFNGARGVGLGRWAFERAVEYSKQRVTFGKPLAENQAIQWHLADSLMELYAARMMALNCAWRLETGEQPVKELAMLKAFGVESGFRAVDRAIQVFGGIGMTNEMRLYDAFHQLRILRIADGSGEIMRRTVANRVLKGDIKF